MYWNTIRRPRASGCKIVFLILIAFACKLSPTAVNGAEKRGRVRWVVDGDTIVLTGGERVRYAGINAHEVAHDSEPGEPYGDEARAFNNKLVLGRWLNLELAGEPLDRYGRLLAYVFLEDGTFVNGELVQQGYAHLTRRQSKVPYWERLLNLQRLALKEKKGIWSLPVAKPEKYYLGNKLSWVFHRPDCQFGLNTAGHNRVFLRNRYEALYQGFSPGRRCRP
jgi:endonuclease YncB( thermonuclease family)